MKNKINNKTKYIKYIKMVKKKNGYYTFIEKIINEKKIKKIIND